MRLSGKTYKNQVKQGLEEVKRRNRLERQEKWLISLYGIMKRVPLVKSYVGQIEARYLMTCPYDEAALLRLTAETAGYTFLASVLAVAAVFVLNLAVDSINLYTFACAALAVYVCYVEVLNARIRKTEESITENMIEYIAAVKHRYLYDRNIPQAVLEAADGLSREMRLQAARLYDILTGTNREELVREYALSQTASWYMKLFLSQAYEVSEWDDVKKKDGSSLFASNLEFLRLEIMLESHARKNRTYKLQGYTLVVLLPVFCASVLKRWGTEFFADLAGFYNGAGRFLVAAAYFATIFCYQLINKAKRITLKQKQSGSDTLFSGNLFLDRTIRRFVKRLEERFAGQTRLKRMLEEAGDDTPFGKFLLKMIVSGAVVFLAGMLFVLTLHVQNRKELLSSVTNIDMVVSAVSERQKAAIEEAILCLTNQYKNVKHPSEEMIRAELLGRMKLSNAKVVSSVTEEIQKRIERYQSEYVHWYEFLAVILSAAAAVFVPLLELQYRVALIKSEKNHEIKQFQVLLLLEKHFPGVTIAGLLEKMETFASVFKPSLRTCINHYSTGPREALLALKQAEKGCPRFTEIVDGFLSVDTVGIQTAFDEVGSNREMLERTEALEEEINLNKNIDMANIVAYIPSFILLGVYFIAPICLNALTGTNDIFEMIDKLNRESRENPF